jgi:hypothetical protein
MRMRAFGWEGLDCLMSLTQIPILDTLGAEAQSFLRVEGLVEGAGWRPVLLALEAEGPGVGSFWLDLVFWEGAGAPGVGAAEAHLEVVDVEGDDVAFWDVDGVAATFEVGHEAGVGSAGEEVFSEGGGGEALSFRVKEGEGAEVGEVAGFLGLEVGKKERVGGGGPAAEDAAGFSIGVGFVGAVAEPGDLVVGVGDGALHAEAGDGAEFPFWGDGDINVEGSVGSDGVGDVSGGSSGGNFEIEGVCVGGGVSDFGDGGIGAGVTP